MAPHHTAKEKPHMWRFFTTINASGEMMTEDVIVSFPHIPLGLERQKKHTWAFVRPKDKPWCDKLIDHPCHPNLHTVVQNYANKGLLT